MPFVGFGMIQNITVCSILSNNFIIWTFSVSFISKALFNCDKFQSTCGTWIEQIILHLYWISDEWNVVYCFFTAVLLFSSIGSVDLDFSSQLYSDLQRAEESLVLASHLHLLFLVTPYDMVKEVRPDWMIYFKQVCHCVPVKVNTGNIHSCTGINARFDIFTHDNQQI